MLRGLKYRTGEAGKRAKYAWEGLSSFFKYKYSKINNRPPIAMVMVGRNDDYMPDFANRLRLTIEWNSRIGVSEPIFVEWNPPPDRPLLATDLVKEFPRLRAYVVPRRLHDSVCGHRSLPLMEYHAKNVGIRRANSDWVIATNADVAFSPETLLSLMLIESEPTVAMTAERADIYWDEWRARKINIIDCITYKRIIPYSLYGTGDFLLASRMIWNRMRGYDENLHNHRIGCDVRGAAQMVLHGASLVRIGRIMHLAHPTSCTEGVRPHHGERATIEDLPYHNSESWGFGKCSEIKLGERIWQLD